MTRPATRPAVHLTPDDGWLNDPLSPTWDGERYHLFFQHVPGSTAWAPHCHWGHATSVDLLHWEQGPVALAPGDGDGGAWSGSVVPRPGGGHRAFYTAVDAAAPAVGWVRVADADTLDGPWAKGDVVARVPEELGATSFRDPFVERLAPDGSAGWRMLVAASLPDDGEGTAAVLSWSSPDLDTWTFDGVAASRASAETEPRWVGSLWECPQLVAVGGSDWLVGSVWHHDVLHHVAAAPATRRGWELELDAWQQVTAGEGYYAPAVFRDAHGEPGLVAWIRGYLDDEAGRAGALSLPHRLAVHEGRLVLRLHPDVEARARAERGGSEGAAAALVGPADLRDGALDLGPDLQVSWDGTHVVVAGPGPDLRLDAPPHDVVVVLDGPVVEVLTLGTSAAVVVPGEPRWPDAVPGATVRRLG